MNRLGMTYVCDCAPGFSRATETGPCVASCGDGSRTPGEECDDGNTESGDGCDALCAVEPGYACFEPSRGRPSECEETCGDGLIHEDAGEECDEGEANSDTAPNACRVRCVRAHCGDGVIDDAEECDQGAASSDATPGVCRTSCRLPFCGDGVVDDGESCDPGGGAALEAASCAGTCEPPDGGASDGGTGAPTDGGCGCRAAGGSGRGALLALALGALALAGRRRRRAS
ncbi:MAG: DUF4215 domain-containing protein [Sandaracinaceae bacterium]|nr:DUF4215 domain-containing protein [Sandaracinaceae bacterium]